MQVVEIVFRCLPPIRSLTIIQSRAVTWDNHWQVWSLLGKFFLGTVSSNFIFAEGCQYWQKQRYSSPASRRRRIGLSRIQIDWIFFCREGLSFQFHTILIMLRYLPPCQSRVVVCLNFWTNLRGERLNFEKGCVSSDRNG